LLILEAQDCASSPVNGVTFEIWNLKRGSYERCPSAPRDQLWDYPNNLLCGPLYTGADGSADTTLTEIAQPGRIGYGRALGSALIVMRDRKTGFPLSSYRLLDAPAGVSVDVVLFPASKDQLAAFPKEIWKLGPPAVMGSEAR
jgi:hypothetical protein